MQDPVEVKDVAQVLLDDSDEYSIINMVTPKLRDRMIELYGKHPEYLEMGELQMRIATKPEEHTEMVRIAFWEEFHRTAQSGLKKMSFKNMWATGVAPVSFYRDYMRDDKKLAWILTPVVSHQLALKSMLYRSRSNIMQLLDMDLRNASGDICPKKAKIFLDTYRAVETRALGAVVQRIDQRVQNIPSIDVQKDTIEKIAELRNKYLEVAEIEESLPTEDTTQLEEAPIQDEPTIEG